MGLNGASITDLPEGSAALHPGEIFVVPKGMQHRPRAAIETHLPRIEATGIPNTSDLATAVPKVTI